MFRKVLPVIPLFFVVVSLSTVVAGGFQEELVFHQIRTSADGSIVPWHSTDLGEAYDHTIRLVWEFWRDMRTCPNGVKYYLQHQVWKKRVDDPRGLGGDQLSMALSSWNLLHQYLGDEAVKENMIFIADYYIDHSLSKSTDVWPNVPFPYNTDLHSGIFDGDMQAGPGFFQPDKAASFGAELIVLYKMTGDRRYLDVAVGIADTLTDKIAAGDEEHSPWPYRVNARTGEVHQVTRKGIHYAATYTANWAPALRLYDDLIDLDEGSVPAYTNARTVLMNWIESFPMRTNRWGPFFEDVATHRYSDTETNADTMAAYFLEHSDKIADWRRKVELILSWSLATFGNRSWIRYGVTAINEQTQFMVPGNSHTSRHASVELMLAEKSGDQTRRFEAIKRLNWATYMVDESGRNRYPESDIWLTDGYGDYVRHYLRSMAASPELAPSNQNHLLRSSSVIQEVHYGADAISYEKFDSSSAERLKLGEWEPGAVAGGERTWDASTRVLEVKSGAKEVTIFRKR